MAEAMLLGVAKSVLGQLSSPALKEALLVWNFEKDLKRLGETIETITCVIHDAEQRPSNQHAVKLWLSRLKVVLYDADDLFDAIAARALRKKAMDGSKFKKECSPGCHNSKLRVLRLAFIEGLECLPEGLIKHLTALKYLKINGCRGLRWISRRGLACLTSLETLRISDCGIVRLEDEDEDKKMGTEISNNMYRGLQRLRVLHVFWHRDLYYGLRFLTSLQELELTYYEEQQVEADNRNSECCTSAPEKLECVELHFGEMNCCFPKWTLNLPCLRELKLWKCGEMNVDDWVAQQTQSTTLVSLLINSKQDVELLCLQNIPWNLLPSLRTLVLGGKLSSIPDGIQHLTSLQQLELYGCWNLDEIPKWMIKLTSLQELVIWPFSMELEDRCTPQTGTDWHLISHIPTVRTIR